MAENKTRQTEASVASYLGTIDPARRAEAEHLIAMLERLSGEPAKLWGPSIIGFGSIHYRYESGREGDMPRIAFSPRKAQLVIYSVAGAPEAEPLLAKLGKHSTGKGCLYLKRLSDADPAVLEEMIVQALARRASAR